MIAAALLLSSIAVAPPACADLATLRSVDTAPRSIRHAFQNAGGVPLRLAWIDRDGERVDLGEIAPGAYRSIETYIGHAFVLTGPDGRCRATTRVGEISSGTYVGTSRYRPVAVRPGWHVSVDRALDPATEPAGSALGVISGLLEQAEAVLPPTSLAQIRTTPIFLHDHAGPGAMYHVDPGWLTEHGRTVEMLNGIEISDAGVFLETVKVQPGSLIHELAHALYARLPDSERAEVRATYRRAMQAGRYRGVKRHDGSLTDAYARTNADEYFAELTEAYFVRNDFFPFTRADLSGYDPAAERLISRLWR